MAVVLVALLPVVATSCSSDDETSGSGSEDTIEIGAGSEETAPAAANVSGEPGEEPAWTVQVPDIEAPLDTADARMAAQSLAGSSGLSELSADGLSRSSGRSAESGDYSGTMTIDVAYYDYCQTRDGNLGFAGSDTYEMDAEVFINPPAELDGERERSPFNLIVGTERGVEASMLLMSAQVVTDTRDGRSALIDYWDIDQDGDDISGVLTDRWPGLIFNSIETSQLLIPCQPQFGGFSMPDAIAEGAELTGTVTDDSIELEVLGQSFDREVRFHGVIEVEREG